MVVGIVASVTQSAGSEVTSTVTGTSEITVSLMMTGSGIGVSTPHRAGSDVTSTVTGTSEITVCSMMTGSGVALEQAAIKITNSSKLLKGEFLVLMFPI